MMNSFPKLKRIFTSIFSEELCLEKELESYILHKMMKEAGFRDGLKQELKRFLEQDEKEIVLFFNSNEVSYVNSGEDAKAFLIEKVGGDL